MTKIPRTDWIPLAERKPEHKAICLVTDGENVTVAVFDAYLRAAPWDPIGVSGYEWEFDIEPTHWMALSVELPQTD